MSDSTAPTAARAVFLSYAREDSAAARRIADGLRGLGVEVWFDQSELRGGDAWDQKIRKQIKDCAIFLPVISQHTQDRGEGYFRLEWKLAVERTHHMAEGIPFLAPVALDRSHEADALVPPEFMRVHWTRLADGLPTAEFLEQIKRLLDAPRKSTATRKAESAGPQFSPPPAAAPKREVPAAPLLPSRAPAAKSNPSLWFNVALVVVTLAVLAYFTLRPSAQESSAAASARSLAEKKSVPSAARAPQADFSAAPVAKVENKSVAVLAFADLSAARDSEYFSDGISEELLNVLAKVPGLKVTARTSAFFFKGKNLPIPEIAAKLGVAYVIEGSVQRAGERVKITAQLIQAADGFHVWSDTFTRDAKDVFAVEEEIAGLIAKQLSLKLGVSSAAATASVSPEAYQLYLAARQAFNLSTPAGHSRAEELLSRALKLEPGLARAHAALSDVRRNRAQTALTAGAFSQRNSPAMLSMLSSAQQAVSLDPDLPEAHVALGAAYWMAWKIDEAKRELGQAIALNPNYAAGHHMMARALLTDGRMDEALSDLRRAVELDPLYSRLVDNFSMALFNAGRPEEALVFADRALVLQPENQQALGFKAAALVMLGRGAEAVSLARTLELDNAYAWTAAFVFALAGERAAAERVLAQRPLTMSDAHTLAALGRYDDCIALIQSGSIVANRVEPLYFLPSFDPIRQDPRFRKALADSGATEAHDRAQAWRKAHPPEKPEAKK